MKKITLMDVTIRDGSYAIDFQYSLNTIKKVVESLSNAGVEMIEVGHGIGVGSDELGVKQAVTEDVVLKEIAAIKGKSKVGVIATAGVTKEKHIEAVADALDFIRLACNVNQPDRLKSFFKLCKKLKLFVVAQMMRTSAVKPKDAAKSASMLADMGAKVVYLVDTGGSFSPDEIEEFVSEIRAKTDVKLGFHGHDNLHLSLANALAAAKAGCEYIDGSLKGIGRLPGNAPLEILALILKRSGFKVDVDTKKLLLAADEIIKPIKDRLGTAPWSPVYLAYKRRDFYPVTVLEDICNEIGIGLWDGIEELGNTKGVVEVDFDFLDKLIKKHGHEPDDVYASLGLTRPR